MANTDVNKYPYTGQAEQNPYGGVSLENLAAVISALLPKGGNNSSVQREVPQFPKFLPTLLQFPFQSQRLRTML
jgi:hypothetical protein